jgi:hypothetical protein
MFARVPATGQDLTEVIKNLEHIGSSRSHPPVGRLAQDLG